MEAVASKFRQISWGKYQTTLYFRGSPFFSSILGGLMTILFGIFLLGVSVVTFSQIFNFQHYNLEQNGFGL